MEMTRCRRQIQLSEDRPRINNFIEKRDGVNNVLGISETLEFFLIGNTRVD